MTLYRTDKLRTIAQLELSSGSVNAYRNIANTIISSVDDIESQTKALIKDKGLTEASLVLPSSNPYQEYESAIQELKGATANNIDRKFKAKMMAIESSHRQQLLNSAAIVTDAQLKTIASNVVTLSTTVVQKLGKQ
jgi:hypothetical protein